MIGCLWVRIGRVLRPAEHPVRTSTLVLTSRAGPFSFCGGGDVAGGVVPPDGSPGVFVAAQPAAISRRTAREDFPATGIVSTATFVVTVVSVAGAASGGIIFAIGLPVDRAPPMRADEGRPAPVSGGASGGGFE